MRIDRNKLRERAIIEWVYRPCDYSPRGNVMASGDKAFDKECEDAIVARIDAGDEWAWFIAECCASYGTHSASDYLGGCIYTDKKDWLENSGYADDMIGEAIEQLAMSLEIDAAAIEAIRADELTEEGD